MGRPTLVVFMTVVHDSSAASAGFSNGLHAFQKRNSNSQGDANGGMRAKVIRRGGASTKKVCSHCHQLAVAYKQGGETQPHSQGCLFAQSSSGDASKPDTGVCAMKDCPCCSAATSEVAEQ